MDDDALGGEERDKQIAECERLDDEVERQDEEMYGRASYTVEQNACSGWLVTIGDEGGLVVHQGLLRPTDRDLIPTEPDLAPAGAPAPNIGPATVSAPANTPSPDDDAGGTETPAGTGPGTGPAGREQTGGTPTAGRAQRLHPADLRDLRRGGESRDGRHARRRPEGKGRRRVARHPDREFPGQRPYGRSRGCTSDS